VYSEKLKVKSGGWRLEAGKWKMKNGK